MAADLTPPEDPIVVEEIAHRILNEIAALSEMLTPRGWNLARAQAIHDGNLIRARAYRDVSNVATQVDRIRREASRRG